MVPKPAHAPVKPIKVLIADDYAILRHNVKEILEKEKQFVVVGEAINGLDAVCKVDELHPDVLVLDVTMPIMDGFEAARRILKRHSNLAIVILSNNANKECIAEARKIGVKGYVPKGQAAQALISAVDAVLRNEEFMLVE